MRILITTGIFPPDIGGPATYVPIIARALVERGHRVTVLTTSEPEHINWDDSIHPFPIMRMNRRRKIWWRLPNYLAQILRHGYNAEVIYANGIYFETALANKFLRKPLVMKIVGDEAWERSVRKGWTQDGFEDFQHKRQSWQAEFLKHLRSWYAKQADRIIVPSEYLKRVVIGWGVSEEKCKVIYNAAEVNPDPSQMPEPPLNFRSGQVRVITAGRLVPWKGVDKVIQALISLPDVTLTVVGDGPCRKEWEVLAQSMGLGDRIWFVGSLTQPALHALLEQHDIFVLVSGYEGLPHILVEAMMAGLTVISSPVGGNLEIICNGINGLLVEPEPEAIAQALRLLITNPDLRRRLASTGRQIAEERFNLIHMVTQTESILREIVKSRK